MNAFFLYTAIGLSIIIAIPAYRVVKGPTIYDRLIATSTIATKTIVLILLIGYLYGRVEMFIDITIAYAVLGFIGSLAIAKYFASQDQEDE